VWFGRRKSENKLLQILPFFVFCVAYRLLCTNWIVSFYFNYYCTDYVTILLIIIVLITSPYWTDRQTDGRHIRLAQNIHLSTQNNSLNIPWKQPERNLLHLSVLLAICSIQSHRLIILTDRQTFVSMGTRSPVKNVTIKRCRIILLAAPNELFSLL